MAKLQTPLAFDLSKLEGEFLFFASRKQVTKLFLHNMDFISFCQ
jgi:hypothetical protein